MQNRFYINESKAKLLLFAHRHDNNSSLSQIPSELISLIMNAPMIEFDAALEDAAFGRLNKLQTRLEANSHLLLQRGNVITPGGFEVVNTTLLECAIGGGDPEMVAMIKPYFAKVENGEEALEKQLAAYRDCVAEMGTQAPYNLNELIKMIVESPSEEIKAALDKKFNPEIKLHKALNEFRSAVQPKRVIKPQMHYNYQTLIHAFSLYINVWNANSSNASSFEEFYKFELIWRQVIGYLQRGLPAVDRFMFANGLYHLVINKMTLIRDTDESFPDFSADHMVDSSGLGFDYGISARDGGGTGFCGNGGCGRLFQVLWRTKTSDLQNLCSRTDLIKRPGA